MSMRVIIAYITLKTLLNTCSIVLVFALLDALFKEWQALVQKMHQGALGCAALLRCMNAFPAVVVLDIVLDAANLVAHIFKLTLKLAVRVVVNA